MNDQERFLVDCVIGAAAEDFESFQIIFEYVHRLASVKRMNITLADVEKALEQSISRGLVEAYLLSPHEPHSQKMTYSAERLQELWFYVTPRGKTAAKSIEELSEGLLS